VEPLRISGVPVDTRQVQGDVELAAEVIVLVADGPDSKLIVVDLRRRWTMANVIWAATLNAGWPLPVSGFIRAFPGRLNARPHGAGVTWLIPMQGVGGV
jgi:hypothetical protein